MLGTKWAAAGMAVAPAAAGVCAAQGHSNVEFAASPEIREKLSRLGAVPASMSQADFGAMIGRDIARWKKVAQEANIRL